MRGASQIENLVIRAKNYRNNIRKYAMSDGMRTILQVHHVYLDLFVHTSIL